ncbi:MAG: alcohol dehydrogenase catalytic domain-containing protein [Planctomycetota bacterium]|jgi:threonine dehydrogenase-like Zn-dependent dehydrogenase
MRALIREDSSLRLTVSRPQPVPAEGETLVRPRRAAVTAADVRAARGGFTGTLGHAFVGTAGTAAGPVAAGSRVVAATSVVCGVCDMCQAGLRDHCRDRLRPGLEGRDGCLADAIALPAANLVPVPADLDDDHAVFAAPLAAAIQAARQLTIEGKPYITVLGDGVDGLLAVQVMARLNASVRLIGDRRSRLALCEKWGIKHRPTGDIGRRADQDVVVDCTGTAKGIDLAWHLVRPRGTVVLTSPVAGDAGVDLSTVVAREIRVIGSQGGPVKEAVGAMARGEVDVVSLIGRRMKLDDGPRILEAAADPDMLAVLVDI